MTFLKAIDQWFSNLTTNSISTYFPISTFTLLHSIRVAYLYHSVLQSQGFKVGIKSNQVSFLQASLVSTTLVISGTTMASVLKGEPWGLFADQGAGYMVSAYMLSAMGMKWLHPILSSLPEDPLKVLCFLIDGFATTFGTLTLGLKPVLQNPQMTSKTTGPLALPTLILPLLCGSGASILVPFFGLLKPKFSFTHPGFLSERLPVDFWGTFLITAIYGTIVDGRGVIFGNLRSLLSIIGIGNNFKQTEAWMGSEDAHVLCSLILSGVYIVNEFGPGIFLGPLIPSKPMKTRAPRSNMEKPRNMAVTTGYATAQPIPAHELKKVKEKQ
ncbi:uncharacterized protein MELLADRAFT_73688 [Melampsora larici-populina 98AG31]|uniref:Uncharacterized protein n=1 Tax=Melampsora larici-populina (strain 98AG31 / pathotype 3-4-7) TaxID=747676 RepID=F4SBY7_MELLP|nr:uncharacterized protein MELLADRAFT_73688 [Melampsora larici-populina 98AG31]EGF97824.1 hypothetical protein MELLADRAFT_73688 [Melampsora larici-populina 98AG31]